MKICIASGNLHKLEEIQAIIKTAFPQLNLDLSLIDRNILPPAEPHFTFTENSIAKAKYYATFTKQITLSEDSGLCINALNGFPGVNTKDFVVECGGILQAQQHLQQMLQKHNDLSAFFICVAALYIPQENRLITSEGTYHGKLSFPPRGKQGFAFDPIFVPNGHEQTIAELGDVVKNNAGHRARAIVGLIQQLLKIR